MYAQIKNGSIAHRGGLPKNFKNVSGFNLQSDAELKALGWLPLVEVGVTLNADETSDGETIAIGEDSVTVTAKKRAITAAEITAQTQSNAMQAIQQIEESIEPRHIRNAALGDDYAIAKLKSAEALLDIERAKLA